MQPLIRRYTTLVLNALKGGAGLPAQAGDEFAKKLVAYLKKRGHLSLLPAIVARVERMAGAKAGAKVVLAKAGDAQKFATSIASALTTMGVPADDYTLVVDERVVGGYVIEGKGKVVDRTYRTALVNLYQKITS